MTGLKKFIINTFAAHGSFGDRLPIFVKIRPLLVQAGGQKQAIRLAAAKHPRAPASTYNLPSDIAEAKELTAERSGLVTQASAHTPSEHFPLGKVDAK